MLEAFTSARGLFGHLRAAFVSSYQEFWRRSERRVSLGDTHTLRVRSWKWNPIHKLISSGRPLARANGRTWPREFEENTATTHVRTHPHVYSISKRIELYLRLLHNMATHWDISSVSRVFFFSCCDYSKASTSSRTCWISVQIRGFCNYV